MVVNTEWGAFGDNGELDYVKTKWDEEVKNISFEAKFVSNLIQRIVSKPSGARRWGEIYLFEVK